MALAGWRWKTHSSCSPMHSQCTLKLFSLTLKSATQCNCTGRRVEDQHRNTTLRFAVLNTNKKRACRRSLILALAFEIILPFSRTLLSAFTIVPHRWVFSPSLAQCWVFHRMLKASNTVMSPQSLLSWEWGLSWMLNGPRHSRRSSPPPGPLFDAQPVAVPAHVKVK